jgi:type IV pilus assembly protein PilQ
MTSMFALWTAMLMALAGPVTEVSITSAPQQTSVLIAVDGEVEFREFTMEGPHRIVLDLMGARHALPRDEYTDVNRGGIRSVRTSQYSENVVRVVLVLNGKRGYSILPDAKGVRVFLDNTDGEFAPWTSGVATPQSAAASASAEPQDADSRMFAGARGQAPTRAPLQQARSQARRISITFTNSPIQDVLLAFASFSGKSIVPGSNISGLVTADIRDQPWDVAMRTILSTQGLIADEDDYGIIRVDNITDLNTREEVEPIVTQAHRINYATATELQQAIEPLLSERGSITVGQGTNTLVVSDINRVQSAVRELLGELDVRTPQVSIQAKIIFVNRTDLDELGVSYELKDSRGNQINQLSDGAADLNGDGTLSLPDEAVEQGQAVVLLGGNSVAALGNAKERLTSPSLTLLSSLVIGRHQLVSFLDALSSVQLSDVQATPQVTTLDNVLARLKVGADVPVRTIDAGAGGGGGTGGVFPTAQVSTVETGIILEATPHVTNTGNILLDLMAERSSADFTASDAGFIKNTQEARTRVLVEDGETVVIAGLTQSERTEFRSGIPLLMDLPVIGRLFRVNREQVIQRDLIILVTPHIVRGPGGSN